MIAVPKGGPLQRSSSTLLQTSAETRRMFRGASLDGGISAGVSNSAPSVVRTKKGMQAKRIRLPRLGRKPWIMNRCHSADVPGLTDQVFDREDSPRIQDIKSRFRAGLPPIGCRWPPLSSLSFPTVSSEINQGASARPRFLI